MNKDTKTNGYVEVQVFQVTMDNEEDQDELNRRMCKPGEPAGATPTPVGAPAFPPTGVQGESPA